MSQQTTPRVREILSWYRSENTGVLTNLHRLLCHGALAGTGKLVILPVDQGFEHGPLRSFLPNPEGFAPRYLYELAIEGGTNAYAAPIGQLAVAAPDYVGEIPLIVKLNSNDLLSKGIAPNQARTCSVRDALAAGATAVGFTIYPGTAERKEMLEEAREVISEARSYGLPTVLWSYPRGEGISKEGETAIDIVSYAAHIPCQLGAHVVKVKLPSAHIEREDNKKAIEGAKLPIATLADRVKVVVKSCFEGQRIVIFSGGETKGEGDVLGDIKAIAAGGGFGSIMGRNAFQRPRKEAVKLLRDVAAILKG